MDVKTAFLNGPPEGGEVLSLHSQKVSLIQSFREHKLPSGSVQRRSTNRPEIHRVPSSLNSRRGKYFIKIAVPRSELLVNLLKKQEISGTQIELEQSKDQTRAKCTKIRREVILFVCSGCLHALPLVQGTLSVRLARYEVKKTLKIIEHEGCKDESIQDAAVKTAQSSVGLDVCIQWLDGSEIKLIGWAFSHRAIEILFSLSRALVQLK
ncbi:hypothetical protein Tco_0071636 [Tanacetum coccineum]